MNRKNHWEQVYSSKSTERLGWYKPHLETSLNWIRALGLSAGDPVIDVGAGVSALAGDLLDMGLKDITVLDISAHALQLLQEKLAKRAALVTWLAGDITALELPANHYRLWHDRAVFHFLTTAEQQLAYRDKLMYALQSGGHLVIGTFAPQAPPRCSGLPVQRYSVERLQETLGEAFELQQQGQEMHLTPGAVEQLYLYCQFQKKC